MSDINDIQYKVKSRIKQHIRDMARHYRRKSNLSQEDLAYRAGVSYRTILRLENGKGCSFESLLSILISLGLFMKIVPIAESTTPPEKQENQPSNTPEQEDFEVNLDEETIQMIRKPVIETIESTNAEICRKMDRIIELLSEHSDLIEEQGENINEIQRNLNETGEMVRDSSLLSEVSLQVAGINYFLEKGEISREKAENQLKKRGIDLQRFLS